MGPLNKQFDDVQLDEMLKRYGEAEPRAGLEGRVLAHLRNRHEHPIARSWRWGWAAAALGIAIVAAVAIVEMRKPEPRIETVTNHYPMVDTGKQQAPVANLDVKQNVSMQPREVQRIKPRREISTEPRLEQFPAPAPLNEQEQMLARYVQERRPEAVMVARAREEIRRQDLARLTAEPPSEP